MQRVSTVGVCTAIGAVFFLLFLSACGGGSGNVNVVTQIVLVPTTVSLNEGAVATLSAVAENSAGNVVAADISFSSSNTAIATVSSGGLICGGVWDANIINCNATNGAGGVGQATITATSNGVSATVPVYVHERVDEVTAVLGASCTTMGRAITVSGLAYSTSAPGCTTASPCDITSTVGPFSFGSNDLSIAALNSSSVLTAGTPGATTIFASVSGVNSVGTPYQTCPAARIIGRNSSTSATVFTLAPGATQALTADVFDTAGQYIQPTLTWGSSSTAVATVTATGSGNNPGTVTAVAPGTAYITASCSYPDCNKFVPAQYSQNLVIINVTGQVGDTVYAASTNSKMLVPFNNSTDTPGTAITLPNFPNSIVADPAGNFVYLGSSTGLMVVAVSTGTATNLGINGTIVAITPDGNSLLMSDSAANNIYYVTFSTQALSVQRGFTTSSSAYTPDSKFNLWVSGTELGAGYPTGLTGMPTLPFIANAVDIIAQGGLDYITAAGQIAVYSTCNLAETQVLPANNPTLVKALPNGNGAVAADSPALDLVTVSDPTLAAGCPVNTVNYINSYDLGAGPFTAQQMFVSSDSTRVWVVTNLPQLLSFSVPTLTATPVPLAGGATPFNGGITQDGRYVYVGASDNKVHQINTDSMTDTGQISVNLQDANGATTAPNLVTVLP